MSMTGSGLAFKATQASLALRDPRWRPVMNVNGAMAALDLNAAEIEELLDLGSLIGFNIAVAATGRRELRLLTRSLEHYRATLGSRPLEITWPEILRAIVPHEKPVVTGVEIQRSLNCDSDLVLDLINAGQLACVPGTRWQRGPGGSPSVQGASFEKFLQRRETSGLFAKGKL